MVLPGFQDGPDLSSEEFRDALRWCLSLPLMTPLPPPNIQWLRRTIHNGTCVLLQGEGIIGLRHTLMKQQWGEMCETA